MRCACGHMEFAHEGWVGKCHHCGCVMWTAMNAPSDKRRGAIMRRLIDLQLPTNGDPGSDDTFPMRIDHVEHLLTLAEEMNERLDDAESRGYSAGAADAQEATP
jgi:hypothetical protein